MIDLPTFALSACMMIPIAIVSTAIQSQSNVQPTVLSEPAAPASVEYLLVVVRHGRVVVSSYLPSDVACLTAARMHRLRTAEASMMRKAMAISFAFLTSVFGGCTTTQFVEAPLSDRIPTSLLTCSGRPAVGALDRQSDVASWIVDLDAAGDDCRRKLGAVRGIVEGEAAK